MSTAIAIANTTATPYAWPDLLAASEKIRWRVEDLIGPEKSFDLGRPFLPESFARTKELSFLSAAEQRTLNQIRGYGYLHMFGLVEEFILPFVVDHARHQLSGDDYRTRALLAFADEEAKHIHLFKCFAQEFERRTGLGCAQIGPPQEVAAAVLSHDALAVALLILSIEWMTQLHWTDAARSDASLDERFKSLLQHHWMEEAQHAQMDLRIVDELAAQRTPEQRAAALDGYLAIGSFVDNALAQQAKFDLDSLERAIGRTLAPADRERLLAQQHQAMRWTFLGSGMLHPKFLDALERLGPGLRQRIEEIAPVFG